MVCSICPAFPCDFSTAPQTDPRTPYLTDVLLLRCCLSPWHESRQVVVGRQRPPKAEQSLGVGMVMETSIFLTPKTKEKYRKATECWNWLSCRDFILSHFPTTGQTECGPIAVNFFLPLHDMICHHFLLSCFYCCVCV